MHGRMGKLAITRDIPRAAQAAAHFACRSIPVRRHKTACRHLRQRLALHSPPTLTIAPAAAGTVTHVLTISRNHRTLPRHRRWASCTRRDMPALYRASRAFPAASRNYVPLHPTPDLTVPAPPRTSLSPYCLRSGALHCAIKNTALTHGTRHASPRCCFWTPSCDVAP